jgi:ubiquinone/menaquinone biosynthesis C-methylase UbiE
MPEKTSDQSDRSHRIYSTEQVYHSETISHLPPEHAVKHEDVMLKIRLDLVERYLSLGGFVLDLCCGNGQHIINLPGAARGIGLDFSLPFLKKGNELKRGAQNDRAAFLCADASQVPLEDDSFDLVYSFTSLYQVPHVDQVILDVARILKPGGACILELGNRNSLNKFVCDAYPEYPEPQLITLAQMKHFVRQANMKVIEHRSFQILPLWSNRPKWLGPLLWPGWKMILAKQVGGRMLDEWISSLPLLRQLAFRHILVCSKI